MARCPEPISGMVPRQNGTEAGAQILHLTMNISSLYLQVMWYCIANFNARGRQILKCESMLPGLSAPRVSQSTNSWDWHSYCN